VPGGRTPGVLFGWLGGGESMRDDMAKVVTERPRILSAIDASCVSKLLSAETLGELVDQMPASWNRITS